MEKPKKADFFDKILIVRNLTKQRLLRLLRVPRENAAPAKHEPPSHAEGSFGSALFFS